MFSYPRPSRTCIHLDPGPHRGLLDIAAQATTQAGATAVPVRFTFHGVVAIAMPGDTVDSLVSAWTDDFDNLHHRAGEHQA